MLEVTEVTAPDGEQFYREFVVPARPALINELAPWPAFHKWSFPWFRERFGARVVRLRDRSLRLDTFIDEVERSSPASPAEYLNQVPLHREFPELVADLSPYPGALAPNWARSRLIPARWGMRDAFCEFFMGGAGSGFSLLHFDQFFVNTYITQVVGDKEFTLYAPADSPRLYPRADHPNLSSIDSLDAVDARRYPLFGAARPTRITVRQGQTIFLPRGVWHASRLLNPSIAVAMSTANAANWSRFSHEFSRDRSRLKRLSKRWLLGAVGACRRITG